MKVYVVVDTNHQQWEEYEESVDSVFSTREGAEKAKKECFEEYVRDEVEISFPIYRNECSKEDLERNIRENAKNSQPEIIEVELDKR